MNWMPAVLFSNPHMQSRVAKVHIISYWQLDVRDLIRWLEYDNTTPRCFYSQKNRLRCDTPRCFYSQKIDYGVRQKLGKVYSSYVHLLLYMNVWRLRLSIPMTNVYLWPTENYCGIKIKFTEWVDWVDHTVANDVKLTNHQEPLLLTWSNFHISMDR